MSTRGGETAAAAAVCLGDAYRGETMETRVYPEREPAKATTGVPL